MVEQQAVWQTIVIGGAPAGLTAALYLARAQLKTLVIAGEAAGGQLMLTTEVENYPGFPTGIQGPHLIAAMRAQAERFGAKILNENVTAVDFSGETKKVMVGETEYLAQTVVVTAGARARLLGVGEERLVGRGVSTCAVCDAPFFKDKETFVVGGGDAAMEDALALAKFAKSVTIIHRGESFKASKIMQQRVEEKRLPVIWNSEVVGVRGEQMLEGIKVKDQKSGQEREMAAGGLFIAIGHVPSSEFLRGQMEIDDHGYVQTRMLTASDQKKEWLEGFPTMTSVNGVFAAGDVVDFRYRQAVTAAGMGCQAALDVERFLTGSVRSW